MSALNQVQSTWCSAAALTQVMSSKPGSSSHDGGRPGSCEAEPLRQEGEESGGRSATLKKLVTLENPPKVVA